MSTAVMAGYGTHLSRIPKKNLSTIIFRSEFVATFCILGNALSKTSFAITLIRFTSGWMKSVVWFIIITINVSLWLAAAFQWIQCMPVQRVWDRTVPGTCMDIQLLIVLSMVTGSMHCSPFSHPFPPSSACWFGCDSQKSKRRGRKGVRVLTIIHSHCSLFWYGGHHSGVDAMESALGSENYAQRKGSCRYSHEYGCIVGPTHFHPPPNGGLSNRFRIFVAAADNLLSYSAGLTSYVKSAAIPNLASGDFTCKYALCF
jgi:hypothetical protein